ncbi:Hypothetical protein, putative [Bodo saltans]|uniref:Uncharacterized protein n=1 Tax=Bodo saltans TaxID=75058 RepID=A0A0S4JI54_BODSA|nr:Hypothetical protein, putative [Bodo saltans]|eukprot:CUG89971.1 Hypothetical protein, putative [Bodo saltans]
MVLGTLSQRERMFRSLALLRKGKWSIGAVVASLVDMSVTKAEVAVTTASRGASSTTPPPRGRGNTSRRILKNSSWVT